MKARDVSRILRLVADILAAYEDKSIMEALEDMHALVKKGSPSKSASRQLDEVTISDEFLRDLVGMRSEEIATVLDTNPLLQNKKGLLDLARKLKLQVSPRQSVDALKLAVRKHFERQRTDTLIRSERVSNEEPIR